MLKDIIWFIKSDVDLRRETCWYNGINQIDGFKFYSKKPFSKSYQYHATIGLNHTYDILKLIQKAIENKEKAVRLVVSGGWGREVIYIWKGSLPKAESQMFDMIRDIQKQY